MVVGSSVILFDPIFQGLAIALMAGEIASLLLSRMTVPVIYFIMNRRKASPSSESEHRTTVDGSGMESAAKPY